MFVLGGECLADITVNYDESLMNITALDGLTNVTNGRFVIEALTDDPGNSTFVDFHVFPSAGDTCGNPSLTFFVTITFGEADPFSLEGTVNDALGYPVECASVVIKPDLEGAYIIVANTDRNGNYFAPEIPIAGFVFVRVWAPGFFDGFEEVMDPQSGEARQLDFELDVISGVPIVTGTVFRPSNAVEDFQQPLGGVKVVSLEIGGAIFQTVYTCSDGRFQAPVPTAKQGEVSLVLSAPGFDDQTITAAPGSDIDVVLVPKFAFPGAIVGVVTNDGSAVEGANAWVTPTGQSTLQHPRLTDDTGLFQVGDIGAGEYEVKVQTEGAEPAIRTVTKITDDEFLTVEIDVADIGGGEGEGEGGCAAGEGRTVVWDAMALTMALLIPCFLRAIRLQSGE
ncbi:MAG: carboxypeptidase-like regulatory domain-containing protein [Candidatus Hydrogenedentota bacterium]